MKLSQRLLDKHPELSKREINLIARTIIISRADRLRTSYIVNICVPNLGRFRSHASKKVRRRTKTLSADRKRKRVLQKQKELTKEYLLW